MGSVCTSNKNKRKEENSQVNNEARNQNPTNNRENVIVENPRQTNVQNNVNIQQNHRESSINERSNRLSNNTNQNEINLNNEVNNNRMNMMSNFEDDLGINWRRTNVGGRTVSRRNNSRSINNDVDVRCPECRLDFSSVYELESHFHYCNLVRNNQAMNNRIHEILSLMQTLNQRVIFDSNRILPHLFINEINCQDRPTEFIDWECTTNERGIPLWTKVGKIIVKDDDYKQILKVDIEEIKKSKYWRKRFWLSNYIRKYINDSSFDYITLVINRENILEDSFNQFQTTQDLDLKKELKIFFVDEVAQDVGGVYREWYSSLIDAFVNPSEGLLYEICDKSFGKNSFFIPTFKEFNRKDSSLDYYEFMGKVLAKGIIDRIIIKINFNVVLLKHILKRKIDLEDLRYIDYEVNLTYQNPCDMDNDLRFVWTIKTSETTSEEFELVPEGRTVLVDDTNKEEFIRQLVNFLTYKSIQDKLEAFLKGFRSTLRQNIIGVFSPEELDFLISGQNKIDLNDWKFHTIYKGLFNENHPTIKLFWEVLYELDNKDLLIFFKFCTGSTRVPIDGFNSLQGNRNKLHKFCIDSLPLDDNENSTNHVKLIEANTCFNRIIMPCYKSKGEIIHVINTIIKNDTNYFGKQ